MSNHHSISITPEVPVDTAMNKAIAEQEGIAETPDVAPASDRPQWLPEKFKSAEDMAKAYSELEKRISGTPEKPKSLGIPEPTKGMNFEPYAKEYEDTGAISDASIATLVSQGFSEQMIRNYTEGLAAISERQEQRIYSLAGGEDKYTAMLEWASETLDEAEVEAFNQVIIGKNESAKQMAVKGLQARMAQANGKPSSLIQGETSGISTGVFRSVAEVTAAMKDKRYGEDPAYRRDVENRLRNSNILNVTSH